MTQELEIQIALRNGCSLAEVLRMHKPRPAPNAQCCADELEDYLQRQHGEPDWTPAAKAHVTRIIERWR